MAWHRELIEVLVTLDETVKGADFWVLQDNSSFRTLVDRIDMKDTDKEWLASIYTREASENRQELSQTLARRVSAASLRRQSVSTNQHRPLSPTSAGTRRTSDSSVASTELSDTPFSEDDTTEHDEWSYMDQEGRLQGPYTVKQVIAWYYAGYLHEQVGERERVGDPCLTPKGASAIRPPAHSCRWMTDHGACLFHPPIPSQVLVRKGVKGELLPLSAHIETLRSYPKENPLSTDAGSIADKINVAGDLRKQYTSWHFDIFALEIPDLYPFIWTLLQQFEFPDIFDFTPKTFWNFMSAVEHYMTRHNNPYHNMYHAADTAHGCFIFLHVMDGAKLLNELEVFTCIIAGLCHDLDHPGKSFSTTALAITQIATLLVTCGEP